MILLASMLVTFVLGSVHAFSVFILPLESILGLPRSEISLIYSFALVAITCSVLLGYHIYTALPSWWLLLFTCLTAAAGLCIASFTLNWWGLFIGYSLLFGLSNGVGYGYSLQLVGREMPEIKGLAMGAVTAAYAVGSIVFARVFALRIANSSIDAAFLSLAYGLLICGIAAALLMWLAGASYDRQQQWRNQADAKLNSRKLLQFWLAYMSSVLAGLMAIGHAAGIALWKDSTIELSTLSAMMIGIGSATGGFLSGWLVDRWPATRFLVGLPLLSAFALLFIYLSHSPVIVVALLTLVGFSYGSVIAIYPVVISNYFGKGGPQAYGRVFTAWGFAGLFGPWIAGLIYDWRGGYELALIFAAAIALLSALIAGLSSLEN
jgi:OFA family oxalate/formate antiporter-like MFS transporter